ncbi:MAG: SDR family oxidoreductase [Dehalococcoidia bacterium]|nr:SDR family oxidoreductase [Dehalococcoidia bacterium]
MLTLAGRGAIIAGAKRVGVQVAERLADEGVNLAIVYRSSRDEAQALHDSVSSRVKARVIQADLSVDADVGRAVEEAQTRLGDLSFAINLASDYPRVAFEDLDEAAYDRGMLAAKANYLFSLHASRAMMRNPGPTRGHLIYFGDWAAGETPYHDFLPYLTAKAAVLFMTRAFALELAPHGILVNAISPGPTAQPPDLPDFEWQEALALAPLHRESSDEEMAEVILTLLRSETITGENIRVDSGRHIVGPGLPKPAV